MDLIRKAPNGRLDALAACRLLWCGALTFDATCVTWDGTTHHAAMPVINNDVISLYGLPRDEAESAAKDVLDLLDALAQDDDLRVPDEQVADGVRAALVAGHLSGASLFMLQCGTHPLIVEPAGKRGIQVRYDGRLARGIPHLQDLLRRMLCHLQAFGGETDPFTVQFVENSAARGTSSAVGLQDVDGCVEGGCQRLDAQIKVTNDLAPAEEATVDAQDKSSQDRARLTEALESNARVTQALVDTMRQHITSLEESHEKEENVGPDPKAKARRDAVSSKGGLPGGAKASRALATKSALYIALGLVIMWLGRCCLIDGSAISKQLAIWCEQALGLASSWLNIIFMKMEQVGGQELISIPPDLFVNVLRIVGFALMALGIIIPVRKILKLRRRLSRELSFSSTHASFMAELAEKQRLSVEADYATALDAWATRMQRLEDDTELARDSLARLEQANEDAQKALVKLGVEPVSAEEIKVSRSENALLKSIRTAPTEEQRHQLIAEHCDAVEKSVKLVTPAA